MILTIPTMLRGYRYDTPLRKGCSRFHMCNASMKCQNYDPTMRECFLCEQRVDERSKEESGYRRVKILGGYKPERKYIPDIQLSIKVLEEYTGQSFRQMYKPKNPVTASGVSADYENYVKATKVMKEFYKQGVISDIE